MKIVKILDSTKKTFYGITQADHLKRKIQKEDAWENYFFLGMLWTDYCRYIPLFRGYYLQFDVSLKAVRRCLYRALRKSPQNPKVLAAMGWTYIIHSPQPKYLKVRRFFQEACKFDPENPFYAWSMLAAMYMLGEYEQSCGEIPGIAEEDVEISFWWKMTRAFALMQIGAYERAQECLARIKMDAIDRLPEPEEAVWTWIEACYCAGTRERAREIYQACHAGDMRIGSPCRKYLEAETDLTIAEHEQNKKEIFEYFNPLRMVRWWDRLVGHAMDTLWEDR